ncbi:MAG: hypothetical protein HZB46_09745 [Solirubrobacterales bacterium]|nr:hypothetical protein [Solirubrobacterales bacterium]
MAVTKELNERAWPQATADAFVIFATDLELTHVKQNLRAAVPEPVFADLRRRGWLAGLS